MTTSIVASSRPPVLVDFALQGGGSHGAFTLTHGESYFDIVMVAIVGAVIVLASTVGSFWSIFHPG